jgi:hypothetical protein
MSADRTGPPRAGKPASEADADDPTLLVGLAVPDGDPDLMAACLVDEFVRLGMSDHQLLATFRSPFFAGAHAIWRARGEAYVRRLVAEARVRWGQPRFTTHESAEA